ncbi:hypothetical protein SUGI_0920230 [Cryptomeria japonica]|uniref:uncharacterized protein LOC131048616 isoform X2 n=1 Tax=Cryptomeria japonica TaxID=3369 RepID=UPI002414C302|nr:uncharacterized protein LOC131048616 isoform X2 [Cryptomeria japonica]GLJ44127.1 hypothetical protein SUGI_0920230 [Cryptomeria japonica]
MILGNAQQWKWLFGKNLPVLHSNQLSVKWDADLHLSSTSKSKNPNKGDCFSKSRSLSCFSPTMVKSNEPEDAATSELQTSSISGPPQNNELELSIDDVHAVELNAATGSRIDAQVVSLQASLGTSMYMTEADSACSDESGELNLEGRPLKKIKSCALKLDTKGNNKGFENEHLQLKCPSQRIGDGATVVGSNNLALSSDKDMSWAHTRIPVDWKQARSWQSVSGHCLTLSGPSLSQQLTYGNFSQVGQRNSHLEQSASLPYLFSMSKSKDSTDFTVGTNPFPGREALERPYFHGRPSYFDSNCKSSDESMLHSINTDIHIRDETVPISTGLPYGNISEPVTLYDNGAFKLDHSPIQLGSTKLAEWHMPLSKTGQHIPRTDFPNIIFPENVTIDLHPSCSIEGNLAQDSRLSQRGTEIVSNPTTIFGISLAPMLSTIQSNAPIPEIPFEMQSKSEMVLQNLQASSYSVTCTPFLSSMKPNDNLLYNSGPPTSHFDFVHSLHQKSSTDSSFQDRGQQPGTSNMLNTAKDFPSLISDLNLSLLLHSKGPSSSLTPENFPSANNFFVATQEMGLNLSELSHSSPNFCGPTVDADENAVPPSIPVVIEGRSTGGKVCLQKLDGYESFALTLSDMFKNNVVGDNMVPSPDNCILSNAIPGFVIAFEDAEGDLLLAGDLSWRDFVRVARRIRVVPAKKNKTEGGA